MIFHQTWKGIRIHDGKESKSFPVEVPGNIQYDYGVANGFSDPYIGNGCLQYEPLENNEWEYRAKLDYKKADGETVWFVSHGIDYKYQISLNGELIYENEGMFAPVELDLTKKLTGDDLLTIRIAPHPKRADAPKRTRDEADRSCKPPVCYGWDWNPRLLVSGLYRDAFIETRNSGYISNAQVLYTLNDDLSLATVTFSCECEKECVYSLFDKDGKIVYSGKDKTFSLASPTLWWCNGEGEPYLYSWEIKNETNSASGKIGFRRVRLVRNEGANDPTAFPKGCYDAPITLELNNRRIFMKGSNLVNLDIFPGRISNERYEKQVTLAKEANMNILRLWGGAGPNRNSFYDICDEKGIMIWQEFMLACNRYPDDEHYLTVLEKEATAIILALRSHPCLAFWCGGNELFNGWSGMDEQSLPLRLLGKLCYDYDRFTPFIKTSPIMGMGHGGYMFYDEEMGGEIYAQFQNAYNTAYTEFGCPSISSEESLKHTIPSDELFPMGETESVILHHGKKAWKPDTWLCSDVLERYFGKATCLKDMVDQSNWLQTEGYRSAFEETRRQWPHCSASLNWCFNEPWFTVGNNSLVLYPDTPKPAYYSVQSALRPVLFSARVTKFSWEEGEKFKAEIWLLNDGNESVSSTAKIYFKLGDKIIPLLNSVCGECAPKTNQECATVTCVLPYDESANEISLVIEAGEHSNEYRLQYKRKVVEVKEKILNT